MVELLLRHFRRLRKLGGCLLLLLNGQLLIIIYRELIDRKHRGQVP